MRPDTPLPTTTGDTGDHPCRHSASLKAICLYAPSPWIHPSALCSPGQDVHLSERLPHPEPQRTKRHPRDRCEDDSQQQQQQQSGQRLRLPSTQQACESLPVLKATPQGHPRCPLASCPPRPATLPEPRVRDAPFLGWGGGQGSKRSAQVSAGLRAGPGLFAYLGRVVD